MQTNQIRLKHIQKLAVYTQKPRKQSVPDQIAARINAAYRDQIKINNVPARKSAGISAINGEFKSELLKTDLDSMTYSVNHKTNEVLVKNNQTFTNALKKLFLQFPEFKLLFKNPEEAVHVLKTYKELIKHPEFKTATKERQAVLEAAAINHDTGKTSPHCIEKTATTVSNHPELSAELIKNRLIRFFSSKKSLAKLAKLYINDHHYAENMVKKIKSPEDYAKSHTVDTFNGLKILADADALSKGEIGLSRMEENKILNEAQYKACKQRTLDIKYA